MRHVPARRALFLGNSQFSLLALAPVLWLDATDLTTLFQDTGATSPVTAPGQSVARWNDKSGNNNHATQATGTAQPTCQTGYLAFDAGDSLASLAIDYSQLTVAAVAYRNNTTDFQNIAYLGNSSFMFQSAAAQFRVVDNIFSSLIVSAATTTKLLVVASVTKSATQTLSINGGAESSQGASSGNANGTVHIGSQGGTVRFLNGRIYELILFNRQLNSVERTGLRNFLNTKHSIY
jgi:hypothetical protein